MLVRGTPGDTAAPSDSASYCVDYGLANVANDLIWQYGLDGAINRLIEMAERLSAGDSPGNWVMRRRRVDPTERIISERR